MSHRLVLRSLKSVGGLHRFNTAGAALVVTMLFIVISVSAVGGFLSVVTKDSYMAKKMNNSTKALYLAEAGIERAISDLFNGIAAWSPGTLYTDETLGEGSFSAEIQEVITPNRVRLSSTGVVGEEDRTISAYVSRPAAFDWGVFSNGRVRMNRATLDSYDSRLGAYGDNNNNVAKNGDLGTNAGDGQRGGVTALKLRNSSRIEGDVVIGPNGVLRYDIDTGRRRRRGEEVDFSEFIYGTTNVSRAETELPTFDFNPPPNISEKPNIYVRRGRSETITEGGVYNSIRVKNRSTLNIDADGGEVDIYVRDKVSVGKRGSINIMDGTKVNIYVGKELKFRNRSSVNANTGDPGLLTIYGTSGFERVDFNYRSQVYGALYLPTVDVKMENKETLYGSLVAGSLKMKNHASIHYDEALAGTGPSLGGVLTVDSWQEKYPVPEE